MTLEEFENWTEELKQSNLLLKEYAEKRKRLEVEIEMLDQMESFEMGSNHGILHNLGVTFPKINQETTS
jgi:hypothetical protein